MWSESRSSYESASAFPAKLLLQEEMLRTGLIRPIHPQIYLTNKCQLSCPYCSCRESRRRDPVAERPLEALERDLWTLSVAGAKAITLTGGGEPLLYSCFSEIVERARGMGFRLGLVTNGEAFSTRSPHIFSAFDWMRVSFDRFRSDLPSTPAGHLGLAYSYVYTPGSENDPNLKILIERAAAGSLTHLRVVSDILSTDDDIFSSPLWSGGVHSFPQGVILQNRARFERGAKRCWLALLKPVIDVDGQVYPCCGAQYAIRGEERNMPSSKMGLGRVEEYISNWVIPQRAFDGRVCDKCFYGDYNRFLDGVKNLKSLCHVSFT